MVGSWVAQVRGRLPLGVLQGLWEPPGRAQQSEAGVQTRQGRKGWAGDEGEKVSAASVGKPSCRALTGCGVGHQESENSLGDPGILNITLSACGFTQLVLSHHSPTHSFLSTYYVQGVFIGAGDKAGWSLASWSLQFALGSWWEKQSQACGAASGQVLGSVQTA